MSESLKSLHKKYSDIYPDSDFSEKADKLFEDFISQEQYVPPEPEAVVKFYEELYSKYGEGVENNGNERQENS